MMYVFSDHLDTCLMQTYIMYLLTTLIHVHMHHAYIHDTGSFRDRQTDKHIPGLGYELNIDLKSLKGGGRHKSTM